MRHIVILGMALMTGACSTIIEGNSQQLAVNTMPAGADCTLNREGAMIARVNPTPGTTTVQKTKYDITVICTKEGFQDTTLLNPSGSAAATFGNLILGGGIGWAIDSATGSDNKYNSPVTINLMPRTPKVSTAQPTAK